MSSTGVNYDESPQYPNIYLTNAIDLKDLRNTKGVEFEVDYDQTNTQEEENESDKYFDEEEMFRNMNFECVPNPENTENDHLSPFDRMAREMEDVSGDGGVLKCVLKQGTGSVVPDTAHVRVHYNGYLENNEEPFDSSRLRGKPHYFKLGDHVVIPGWEIGVVTMRKNEMARFLIRSEYAYGPLGVPPRIPADVRIMFEIELLGFVEREAADNFFSMTEEEQAETPFQKVLEVSNTERTAGNDFFKNKQVPKAMTHYAKAQTLLEDVRLKDRDEEEKRNKILLRVYLNQALCSLKMSMLGRAITYCDKSLALDQDNVKALFRRGQALRRLQEFDGAKSFLARAHKLSPNSKDIAKELTELNKNVATFRAVEKNMYRGIFTKDDKKIVPVPRSGPTQTTKSDGTTSIVKTPVCSQDLKDCLDMSLKGFVEDKVRSMIDIPVKSFTEDEVNYITTRAEKLDLKSVSTRKYDTLKILTLRKK